MLLNVFVPRLKLSVGTKTAVTYFKELSQCDLFKKKKRQVVGNTFLKIACMITCCTCFDRNNVYVISSSKNAVNSNLCRRVKSYRNLKSEWRPRSQSWKKFVPWEGRWITARLWMAICVRVISSCFFNSHHLPSLGWFRAWSHSQMPFHVSYCSTVVMWYINVSCLEHEICQKLFCYRDCTFSSWYDEGNSCSCIHI